ncbi:hypothetical protein AWB68_03373 [Caballeronia choica]|uniref:Uncharacterized protein n=1 Tax=Caballeronia choica TaxID=326476 RepID=A0A158J4B9_9BURK|nr:hypothetical protein AWB68_03373 [Caballeronia choica]
MRVAVPDVLNVPMRVIMARRIARAVSPREIESREK